MKMRVRERSHPGPRNSVVVELYGGGCGDRLSGAVADGDGDFRAVAAEHSSISGTVLAVSRKRRYKETKRDCFQISKNRPRRVLL